MEKHVRGKKCDFEKAEKHLRDALAADVRFGPAHHSLGVLYFWQRKLYLAAWEFEYAARLMSDRFEPLNNLGLVYESVGKYEQAKTFYRLAREKSPNDPEVIANLARARASSSPSLSTIEIRPSHRAAGHGFFPTGQAYGWQSAKTRRMEKPSEHDSMCVR